MLLLLALPLQAGEVDAKVLKKMEDFGVRWWKARPPTKFQSWDPAAREALLEEARGFGAIPEGSLERVRDALWKSLRKHGPKGKGRARMYIEDHGYKSGYTKDEMWALVKGSGKNQGLVMSLHGGGEGAGSADPTFSLKGCITIAPQGLLIHGDNWNTVHGEKQILTYIEIAKAQFDVDPDRVYVGGFSMGGTGSWHMAGRFPDLFAAAAPCAGVLMAQPKSQLPAKEDVAVIQYGIVPNVRNLAMYYFIGLEDRNCMPGTYLYVADMLDELRKQDPGGYEKIHFKTYPGLAHAFPPGEPSNCLKFLAEQRRDTYPEKIVWEYALNPFPLPTEKDTTRRIVIHTMYWIRHDRPMDRMQITARREGNEFHVELGGADAEGAYVMLNPAMFDPKADVVVHVDGKEAYRGRPEPDFVTVVESLDSRLDKSLTFDRKIPLWK